MYRQQPPREASHRGTVQPAHGFHRPSDRMANSYSMSRRNFKWTMKLFFHLLDLTVLKSWILLSSCGAQYTHRDFRLLLVRNLIEEAGKSQDRPTPSLVGRPSAAAANIVRLNNRHNQHWQRNPRNSAAAFVHLTVRERPRFTSAPSVT